jgi:hypothetical protein
VITALCFDGHAAAVFAMPSLAKRFGDLRSQVPETPTTRTATTCAESAERKTLDLSCRHDLPSGQHTSIKSVCERKRPTGRITDVDR